MSLMCNVYSPTQLQLPQLGINPLNMAEFICMKKTSSVLVCWGNIAYVVREDCKQSAFYLLYTQPMYTNPLDSKGRGDSFTLPCSQRPDSMYFQLNSLCLLQTNPCPASH